MKRKDYAGIIQPQYTGKEIEVDATVELIRSLFKVPFYFLQTAMDLF